MKKIILPLGVSVLACATAFGSLNSNTLVNEYIQLIKPNQCQQITAGCNGLGATCVVNSAMYGGQYIVYLTRVNATTCAQPRKHNGGIIVIP